MRFASMGWCGWFVIDPVLSRYRSLIRGPVSVIELLARMLFSRSGAWTAWEWVGSQDLWVGMSSRLEDQIGRRIGAVQSWLAVIVMKICIISSFVLVEVLFRL